VGAGIAGRSAAGRGRTRTPPSVVPAVAGFAGAAGHGRELRRGREHRHVRLLWSWAWAQPTAGSAARRALASAPPSSVVAATQPVHLLFAPSSSVAAARVRAVVVHSVFASA